jgi:hypothetical protein
MEYYFIDSERNCTTNIYSYLKNLDIQLAWFGTFSFWANSDQPTSEDVVTHLREIRESRYVNQVYLTHVNSRPNSVSTEILFDDPRMDVIKKALCLMYSQHPDVFAELIQICESDAHFTENMKLFYDDILYTVMNPQSYVLK